MDHGAWLSTLLFLALACSQGAPEGPEPRPIDHAKARQHFSEALLTSGLAQRELLTLSAQEGSRAAIANLMDLGCLDRLANPPATEELLDDLHAALRAITLTTEQVDLVLQAKQAVQARGGDSGAETLSTLRERLANTTVRHPFVAIQLAQLFAIGEPRDLPEARRQLVAAKQLIEALHVGDESDLYRSRLLHALAETVSAFPWIADAMPPASSMFRESAELLEETGRFEWAAVSMVRAAEVVDPDNRRAVAELAARLHATAAALELSPDAELLGRAQRLIGQFSLPDQPLGVGWDVPARQFELAAESFGRAGAMQARAWALCDQAFARSRGDWALLDTPELKLLREARRLLQAAKAANTDTLEDLDLILSDYEDCPEARAAMLDDMGPMMALLQIGGTDDDANMTPDEFIDMTFHSISLLGRNPCSTARMNNREYAPTRQWNPPPNLQGPSR